ncbi:hypothetical protein [Massilia antarctica]|uniref:hypothetical protein n=1 Tax=Massilia antarctica TaxID=2765360 RepID=UPI0006BB7B66|nr:hypothetical protein [Massilia sp. H27-R4]MCY0911167.1 hypothetical protein [Massilia sp. H27-R4]CUI05246.1 HYPOTHETICAL TRANSMEMBRANE PROTEIN [Janthinobacterium sp. CG23_2]CUU29032.1 HYPOTHETICAL TRANSMEMBRANE PROTEIN [Janthinobacterium sp. CG23_2]
MPHSPPCFSRLGLSEDADARAVRRAYARELKQIDQERDAAGFQCLREAYDMALAWCAQAAEPRMPAQADSAMHPLPPDLERGDPQHLCDLAIAQFGAALPRLTQAHLAGDDASWRRELQRILDDEAMVNVCARSLFEEVMTHLLAAGWKPGHETLLPVAASLFGWAGDRSRLLRFGEAGVLVDHAVAELALFNAQGHPALARRRRVLARLREPARPGIDQLMQDMPWLDQMLERFPNMVALVVSLDAVDDWRAMAVRAPLQPARGHG